MRSRRAVLWISTIALVSTVILLYYGATYQHDDVVGNLPYDTQQMLSGINVKRSRGSSNGDKFDYIGLDDSYVSKQINASKSYFNNQGNTEFGTQEVRHIAFLKVHKAASTTMQNVFFRFGMRRNLTFVFTTHRNYFSRAGSVNIPVVEPSKRSGGYDILCNHGIFNYQLYSKYLPKDTVYLAIVREPLSLFVSAVNYYMFKEKTLGYIKNVQSDDPVRELIHNTTQYEPGLLTYTRNSMARDFGFHAWKPEDVGISEKLKELREIFRCVLVVEYFDESLVLMKRLLNWSFHDIIYMSKNAYDKGTEVNSLSGADVEVFKRRNYLDYRIYDFFNKTFWDQMSEQSPDIYDETLFFRHILTVVSQFCNSDNPKEDVLTIPESDWEGEFTLRRKECFYMALEELKFIDILRKLQGSELKKQKRKKS